MIPFTLLIYMNFVIVKTVKRSRKMFITHDTIAGTVAKQNENERMETRMQKTMKSAENQVTIMLLLVTTLFLVYFFQHTQDVFTNHSLNETPPTNTLVQSYFMKSVINFTVLTVE